MGTVFVGGGVILVIFLAVRSIYKDKKSGKACSGQCGGCKGCH
ncbi:MAG: FeoB-associated Cys-rich membrane protein [Frisingicoccus sp.]|nr:FeoB-associated Cys-rich membrane protein [Frisingicoccus sp.]MDY4835826.1 FeoB-associated Cys-rich membrane protein [Frisingicoccus sp.]MDY5956680.1 FeoB-associated Cys-rich membrane protein [Frisingicoccus sp.]